MKRHLAVEIFSHRDDDQLRRLQTFCDECQDLGIKNNSSFKNIKLQLFEEADARLWLVTDLEKSGSPVIGMAGAHRLPEVESTCFRILYRGCMLPKYRGIGMEGLSKKHLNSFPFRYLAPLQIAWAQERGGNLFVVTTNIEPDLSGTSNTDRLFQLLERQKLVEKFQGDVMLNFVRQNIWKLDPANFPITSGVDVAELSPKL